MSTTTAFISLPKDSEQDGLIQECEGLLSTLPKERWFGASPYIYKYKGFWLNPNQLPGLISCQTHFQAEDTDVLLVTTPKSGTTWLKALMFTLVSRKNYPINQNHPLFHQNPHALVPFMELCISPDYKGIPNLSFASGRLFSGHCPFSLLPDSVLSSDCKIVYLCRNIKDLFVSLWHFTKKLGTDTSLEDFFDLFCKGVSIDGPVWDHALDYWKHSLEKPEKVLFLKYEALKEEPGLHLKLLAEFLGCPITIEEEAAGLVDEILRLCSFDHLSNLEVNKNGSWWAFDNHIFFRKGEIGDWKNCLTNEMAERLDQITAQKFHGSGLIL